MQQGLSYLKEKWNGTPTPVRVVVPSFLMLLVAACNSGAATPTPELPTVGPSPTVQLDTPTPLPNTPVPSTPTVTPSATPTTVVITPTSTPVPTPTNTPIPPTPVPLSDLYIQNVSYQAAELPNADGSVTYTFTVDLGNQGSANSGQFNTAAVDIGTQSLDNLVVDAMQTLTFTANLTQGQTFNFVVDNSNMVTEENENNNVYAVAVEFTEPSAVAVYRAGSDLSLDDSVWQALEGFSVDQEFDQLANYLASATPAMQQSIIASPLFEKSAGTINDFLDDLSSYHPQIQQAIVQIPEWSSQDSLSTAQLAWADIQSQFYSNERWRSVHDLDNIPESHVRAELFAGAMYHPSTYQDCGLEELFEQQGVTSKTVFCDGDMYGITAATPEFFLYTERATDPAFAKKDQIKARIHHMYLEQNASGVESILEMSESDMELLDLRELDKTRSGRQTSYTMGNQTFMLTPPADSGYETIYEFFSQIANDPSYESTPGAGPRQTAYERILSWAMDVPDHITGSGSIESLRASTYGQYSPQRPDVPPSWAIIEAEVADSQSMAGLLLSAGRAIGIPVGRTSSPFGPGAVFFVNDNGEKRYIDGDWPLGHSLDTIPWNRPINQVHFDEQAFTSGQYRNFR